MVAFNYLVTLSLMAAVSVSAAPLDVARNEARDVIRRLSGGNGEASKRDLINLDVGLDLGGLLGSVLVSIGGLVSTCNGPWNHLTLLIQGSVDIDWDANYGYVEQQFTSICDSTDEVYNKVVEVKQKYEAKGVHYDIGKFQSECQPLFDHYSTFTAALHSTASGSVVVERHSESVTKLTTSYTRLHKEVYGSDAELDRRQLLGVGVDIGLGGLLGNVFASVSVLVNSCYQPWARLDVVVHGRPDIDWDANYGYVEDQITSVTQSTDEMYQKIETVKAEYKKKGASADLTQFRKECQPLIEKYQSFTSSLHSTQTGSIVLQKHSESISKLDDSYGHLQSAVSDP